MLKAFSTPSPNYRCPTGSVLGPLLFSLYVQLLHHYADDLQLLYVHFDFNKSSHKTLFIAFVPPYYNTLVDNTNIKIGSLDISVASSVTNLDVRLDRNLKQTAQPSHILDVQVAEIVMYEIFTSTLDYCNSLLAGLTLQDFTALKDYRTLLQDVY